MTKLAICSSMYHIYDNQLKLTNKTTKIEKDSNNNLLLRMLECFDGLSIILCCGNYWLPEKTVFGLMNMYAVMKMVSNIELIKYSIYLSTVTTVITKTPIASIPLSSGLFGIYDYFNKRNRWNHVNRTIWHLGNSIFITVGYLHGTI
jgi:hypothetical protein